MSHFSKDIWQVYVTDHLTEEQREELEHHAQSCPPCSILWMESVQELSGELPRLEREKEWLQQLMCSAEGELRKYRKTRSFATVSNRKRLWNRSLFQYLVAASLTIVLLSSGLFQALLTHTTHWTHAVQSEGDRSVSEQIVSTTSHWIDQMSVINKGGKRP